MPVLKQQHVAEQGGSAIVLDMADLARQAEQIKTAARHEAQRIVTAARDEVAREAELLKADAASAGREEGHAVGLEEGRRQGRAEALAETSEALAEVEKGWLAAIARWEEDRLRILEGCEASILDLAWRLAKAVVHRVQEVDHEVVLAQIAESLRHVMRPTGVTVRVHGDDRPLVEQTMPQLSASFTQIESMILEVDDDVGRGGCVVTYGEGRVDASIETQMRRLVAQVIQPEPGVEITPEMPTSRRNDEVNAGPS